MNDLLGGYSAGGFAGTNFAQYDIKSDGDGFLWDGENIGPGNIRRHYAGPDNRVGMYFTGIQVMQTPNLNTKTSGRSCPNHAQVLEYFSAKYPAGDIDDPTISPYVHTPSAAIGGLSSANPCVLTLNAHALITNDTVRFSGITQEEWSTLLNDTTFKVTYINANTVSLNDMTGAAINTIGYTAYNPATDPGTVVTRRKTISNSYFPRIGGEDYLDFLFGAANGSLIDANGNDCWFKKHYLDVFENISWIAHDNVITVWPGTAAETDYNSGGKSQDHWWTYFNAFKTRILDPRGIKLVVNIGSWVWTGTVTKTAFDVMTLVDGFYAENVLSDGAGVLYPFSGAVNQDLFTFLCHIQEKAENNKIAMINDNAYMRIAFKATYSGAAAVATMVVANNLMTVTVDADVQTYQLDHTDYDTISKLTDAIAAHYADITFAFNEYCYWGVSNETKSEILLNNTYDIKAAPKYPEFRTCPRAGHVMMASVAALAGGNNCHLYTHPSYDNVNGPCYSDMPLIFDQLGTVDLVAQPKTTVATDGITHADMWADAGGALAGLKYRVYTNGVAFYNSNAASRTVAVDEAGMPWVDESRTAWYDMGNDINTCYVNTVAGDLTSSTSVTLATKKGTICLFNWS